MRSTTCTAELDCPTEEAFGYVTDPGRFVEWQRNIVGGSTEGDGPAGVGTRIVMRRRIAMATRTFTSEITQFDEPRRWRIEGIDGPIRGTVTVDVEPSEPARSRVTIDVGFRGYGIGKLLVPLFVRRQCRREMPANVQALKERLDSAVTTRPADVQPR